MSISTVSDAFILSIDGSRLEGVVVFSTIDVTEKMLEFAKPKNQAIVIRGGLFALECARGLVEQCLDLTYV
ncbi:hypothetical protein, partial [Staphylococcus pseudintermedius]|uniref:hypothetical protein n=1 Tax=Staphylococcus pseudintermedius TaxID=283734 RepID=UPI0021635630